MIYDEKGNHLDSTIVTDFDMDMMWIDVQEIPPVLRNGKRCRLLILSSPSPYGYQGKVIKVGSRKTIAIYYGHEKENRGLVRHKISLSALVENLIYTNRAYVLHTPLEVELINISQGGVRFRAPQNALSDGDRFQMRMKISVSDKLIIADVVNHTDGSTGMSEYGCSFVIGSERVV